MKKGTNNTLQEIMAKKDQKEEEKVAGQQPKSECTT